MPLDSNECFGHHRQDVSDSTPEPYLSRMYQCRSNVADAKKWTDGPVKSSSNGHLDGAAASPTDGPLYSHAWRRLNQQ